MKMLPVVFIVLVFLLVLQYGDDGNNLDRQGRSTDLKDCCERLYILVHAPDSDSLRDAILTWEWECGRFIDAIGEHHCKPYSDSLKAEGKPERFEKLIWGQ